MLELSLPGFKKEKERRKTNLPPPRFISVDTEVLLFCFSFLFSFLTFCHEELQPSTGVGNGASSSVVGATLPSCGRAGDVHQELNSDV